jgi:hypothetical protein
LDRTERIRIMINISTLADQLAQFKPDVALDCAQNDVARSDAIDAARELLTAAYRPFPADDDDRRINASLTDALTALDRIVVQRAYDALAARTER